MLYRQPGRARHVAGYEIRSVLHQGGDKRDVAGKAVKAGNQKHGAALSALCQRREELRPVRVLFAALHLDELGHELPGADESRDGRALGVKPEAADSLPVGQKTGQISKYRASP
jgi:hypothetical protein